MLLGRIKMTDKGIKLIDVDGSETELSALDAVYMRDWLNIHLERLTEILRRNHTTLDQLPFPPVPPR